MLMAHAMSITWYYYVHLFIGGMVRCGERALEEIYDARHLMEPSVQRLFHITDKEQRLHPGLVMQAMHHHTVFKHEMTLGLG